MEPDWCEIDFDGLVIECGPGDGIFIPSGEEHRYKTTVLLETMTVILVEDSAG